MSLVPLLFSDWWQDLDHPHRIFDQDFGHGLHPEQLVCPSVLESYLPRRHMAQRNPSSMTYYRPWSELMRQREGGGTSTVKADKDKFEVILDVKHFKPEEITVKVVDKFVIVEGQHEEKPDEHGYISRNFVRKYLIPEQCDADQVSSSLSSDGVLNIEAPRKQLQNGNSEKMVKIEHTGKPAIRETQEQDKPVEKKEQTPAKKK